jgi:hypothetical protein
MRTVLNISAAQTAPLQKVQEQTTESSNLNNALEIELEQTVLELEETTTDL